MPTPKLDHIMSYTAQLADPEVVGPTPEGIRVNFYVTGGAVTGPRLTGKLRPVGADWLIIRPDGMAVLDVRAIVETTDAALIYVQYHGTIDLGMNGYDQFLQGVVPPSGTVIRTSPRMITSDARYLWVNRLHCVALGQAFLERSEVAYDVLLSHTPAHYGQQAEPAASFGNPSMLTNDREARLHFYGRPKDRSSRLFISSSSFPAPCRRLRPAAASQPSAAPYSVQPSHRPPHGHSARWPVLCGR